MNDDLGTSDGTPSGRPRHRPQGRTTAARQRVVVVGPCASGKTTLVRGLRQLGFQAVVCGQEHSEIPALWRRSGPGLLVALEIDLETVRRRRGADWSEAFFDRQRLRLAEARAAADVALDVSHLTEAAVLARVVRALELAGPAAGPTSAPPDACQRT